MNYGIYKGMLDARPAEPVPQCPATIPIPNITLIKQSKFKNN